MEPAATGERSQTAVLWHTVLPGLFAILFATGVISAKYVLVDAEPLTILFYRFVVVAGLLAACAAAISAPWPASPIKALHSVVVGALIHGFVMSGFFMAMDKGMPAAIAALIFGTQPTIATFFSRGLLGERIGLRQWLGLLLGFAGLILVLGPPLAEAAGSDVTVAGVAFLFSAVLGMTFGAMYQKTFSGETNLVTGGLLQHVGAAAFVGLGALLFETGSVDWTPLLILNFSWLVVGVSIGALTLFMVLLRHGAVSRVSTLFYLVPPLTALMSFFLFSERLTALQLVGFAVTVFAVWLAGRDSRPAPSIT
ncbi:MAG: DMT family transporter [Hyphomicrobiales bacterium]|nr:DMT family transporter [Hyphomicrobiales bacterium]